MSFKRTAILLVTLAWAQGQAHAQSCDERQLQPLLERFAIATSLPLADCVREIEGAGGDAFWQGECRRIDESPNAGMLREHARRMSIKFAEVQTNEAGATAVIVNLHGPDVLAFNEAMERRKRCDARDPASQDAAATSDAACGAWSWADIPVIDRHGAILLACKRGAWAFVSPDAAPNERKPSAAPRRKD
ncbi:hypothetical protein V1318_18875 [Lysobacter sp. CCNWLW3]|uniref:hypothetical protein n=1 Tax=unclassified Lysobacter TaxID=2635362 RepID=UPI002FD1D962